MSAEILLAAGWPRFFGDQVRDANAFATAPNAGGGVEGQLFVLEFTFAVGLRCPARRDLPGLVLEFHFFQLPDQSLAQTVAGFVF